MQDGRVQPKPRIRIASDRLTAELELPPQASGEPPSLEDLLAELRAAGVTHGIDEDAVRTALNQPGTAIVVARGAPPEHGRDGRVEWLVEPSGAHAPSERADGTVDYYDLGLIRVVKAGDVLARLVPPADGTPGTGVDGRPLAAKRGKEAKLPRGPNMEVGGDELRAACDGHVARINGTVCVQPVFEVAGDVDFGTGNIVFSGSVRVRGSVQQGFTIRSGGDVDIAGIVAGATIEAAGHLRVGKGIQGSHRGAIRAGGNVVAKFVENADVHAGGDVLVSDAILHSQVGANGKVYVAGRPGRLAGGHVRAGTEVTAAVLGAPLGTQTIVEVGAPPALHERLNDIRTELRRLLPELERAASAARMLKGMHDPVRAGRLQPIMLQRMAGGLEGLTLRREQLEAEMAELERQLDAARSGRVTARERVLAGTVIRFGHAYLAVEEDMAAVRFRVNADGLVEALPA